VRALAPFRQLLARRSERTGRWDDAERHYRAAVRAAPDRLRPWLRLVRLLERRNRRPALEEVLAAAAALFPDEPRFVVPYLEHRLDSGAWAEVRSEADRLRAYPNEELRRFAQALDDALVAEARFAASARPDTARLRAWWPRRPYPGNLGDVLTPFIVEAIAGVPPRRAPPEAAGVLMMAGSTIDKAGPGTVVWGTGTLRRDTMVCPTARFHAVRGPITRAAVIRSGGVCPAVYGDPGLMLPRLYRPSVPRRWRLGLIRHYQHRPLRLRLEGVREIEILRVGTAGVRAFVDELLACEAILSSSLHGVVLAHAYGVPVRWITFSTAERSLSGDGGKFADHFAAVGLDLPAPLDLSAHPVLDADRLAPLALAQPAPRFDAGSLWRSCPLPT
jgi:hypothetical protein